MTMMNRIVCKLVGLKDHGRTACVSEAETTYIQRHAPVGRLPTESCEMYERTDCRVGTVSPRDRTQRDGKLIIHFVRRRTNLTLFSSSLSSCERVKYESRQIFLRRNSPKPLSKLAIDLRLQGQVYSIILATLCARYTNIHIKCLYSNWQSSED